MTIAAGQPLSKLLLVTTTDLQSDRDEDLRRLITSVEAFRINRPDIAVRHHLLFQRCEDVAAASRQIAAPDWMTVTAIDRQVPLSVARNLILDAVLAEGQDERTLVGFPDDDGSYPDGVLERIVGRFAARPELDLWLCRYGLDARNHPDVIEQRPTLQKVLSFGSSNTIFVRGSLLQAIGGFDETLGLGTPARGGEDTEFVMRAFHAARAAELVPARMVRHRDFNPAIRAKYYGGSTVAIGRHASRSSAGMIAFARKLAVGAALLAKRELSASQASEALKLIATNRAPAGVGRPSDIRRPARIQGR